VIKINNIRREAGFIERFRGEKRLARRIILTKQNVFWSKDVEEDMLANNSVNLINV